MPIPPVRDTIEPGRELLEELLGQRLAVLDDADDPVGWLEVTGLDDPRTSNGYAFWSAELEGPADGQLTQASYLLRAGKHRFWLFVTPHAADGARIRYSADFSEEVVDD